MDTLDLTNRIARCGYKSCTKTAASSKDLAFFEYQGLGSKNAELLCGECGMHEVVHAPINPSTGRPGITNHDFTPKGDVGYDQFYCGCRGWD